MIYIIQFSGCKSSEKFRKVSFDSSLIRLKFKVNNKIAYTPCKITLPESCNRALVYLPDGNTTLVPFELLPKSPALKNNLKKISSWSLQLLALPFMILGGGVLALYALDSSEEDYTEDDLLVMLSAFVLAGFGALLSHSAESIHESIEEDFVYFDLSAFGNHYN